MAAFCFATAMIKVLLGLAITWKMFGKEHSQRKYYYSCLER